MGLMQEKKKLTDKPLAFKNPRESAIVGAAKPVVGALAKKKAVA